MHLARLFQRSVHIYSDRPALAIGFSDGTNYIGLDAQIRALAFWMRSELRLKEGDRVALAMKNCPQYAQALLASWHAGLCAVPINSKLHPSEIEYILRDSGSGLCLTDAALYEQLAPVVKAIDACHMVDVGACGFHQAMQGPLADESYILRQGGNTPAWLFYTSGTTGRPKGVVLSHANLVNMALNFYADVQALDETDVLLHAAPMSHGSGLYSVPCFLKGALQVVPPSGGFDEAEVCEMLRSYSNVSLFAAPTIVKRLVKYVADNNVELPGLKSIIVAGAPFYIEDVKEAVRVLGPRVAQIYGQGESPMSITAQTAKQIARAVEHNDDNFLSSVGYAQTSIELTIAGTDGAPLPPDELGEIMVAGPTVMQEYWLNDKATEETLAGGRLHTGDIGLIDHRGLLHLKDRSKDVIISGGTNIYPREVEETLIQHPAVADVAVIGMPDPHWGESILAFVVLAENGGDVTPDELEQHCLGQMARFKRPKQYVFLEELPKNATGKVLKRRLIDMIPATP